MATLQNLFIKTQNTPQFQTFQEQFDANIFVEDNLPCLINSIQNKNLGFKKKKKKTPMIFHKFFLPELYFIMSYITFLKIFI